MHSSFVIPAMVAAAAKTSPSQISGFVLWPAGDCSAVTGTGPPGVGAAD